MLNRGVKYLDTAHASLPFYRTASGTIFINTQRSIYISVIHTDLCVAYRYLMTTTYRLRYKLQGQMLMPETHRKFSAAGI